MSKILLTQSHYERKPMFALTTALVEFQDKILVTKEPLKQEAKEHVKHIYENFIKLRKTLPQLKYPEQKLKKDTLEIEYIVGKTLEAEIEQLLINGDYNGTAKIIDQYITFLRTLPTQKADPYKSPAYAVQFDPKEEFSSGKEHACLEIGLFDINFDNFIKKGSDYYLIDAEWCFEFQIPLEYMILRSIFYLSIRMRKYLVTMVSDDLPCYNIYQDTLIPVSWLENIDHSEKAFLQILEYDYNMVTSIYNIRIPKKQKVRKNYKNYVVTYPSVEGYASLEEDIVRINKFRNLKTTKHKEAQLMSFERQVISLNHSLDNNRELLNHSNSEIRQMHTDIKDMEKVLNDKDLELTKLKRKFESPSYTIINKFSSLPVLRNKHVRLFLRRSANFILKLIDKA